MIHLLDKKTIQNLSIFEQKNAQIKKSLLLFILQKNKAVTVAECGEKLRLSFPKSKSLIEELVKREILTPKGKVFSGGRQSESFDIVPEASFFVGVEIKQDKILIGAINLKNKWLKEVITFDFILEDTLEALNKLVFYIKAFIKSNALLESKIAGISVIIPGHMNLLEGKNNTYFSFLEDPLDMYLSCQMNISVFVDNDTRAIAMGEYDLQHKNEVKNVIFINIDYGLALALIIDGNLYYGKNGYAGEFGHSFYSNNNILCKCGKRGCLETEISSKALLRKVGEDLKKKKPVQFITKKEDLKIQNIIAACSNKDALIINYVQKMGNEIGIEIAHLINIFNPERVIIGGVLSLTQDCLLDPIKKAVNQYCLNIINKETQICLAKESTIAGVFGACILARKKILS